jgi:hypothetical protein
MRTVSKLAGLTLAGAAALGAANSLTAVAARPGGTINYFEVSTANGTGTTVLTGAITDYGVDHEGALANGSDNEIVLKKGTFDVDIDKLDRAVKFSVNAKTCVYSESGSGPTSLLAGTGAYAGIKGTLTITVSGRGILPRSSNGRCASAQSAPPLVAVSTAQGSGKVSF